jgi:hypothetical protein
MGIPARQLREIVPIEIIQTLMWALAEIALHLHETIIE